VAQINSKLTPSGSVTTPASGSVAFFTEETDGGRLYIKDSDGNVYPAASGSGGGSSLIAIENDGTSVGNAGTLNFSGSAVDSINIVGGVATIGLSGGGSGSGSSGSSGVSGDAGSSGSSGADGANGSSGSSGANGADGSSGSSGADGANGSSGSSGADGAAGADGSSGSSGVSGDNGSSGSSGADGAAGADGSSGSSGADGTSGSSGADGANGSSGSSGADGANGSSGSSGADGATGPSGSSGSSGADGATGATGSSGSSGADGATGATGSSGSSGADGATGATGSSGSSGANGAPGTSGSSGADGATGATGSSGSSGANGAPGTSGSSGADGAAGANGSSGSSGATGNAGSSGSSGADGAAGSSGVSGTSGTSAAGGGGTPYNNVVRYTFTSGNDLAQLLSSGNIISGLSWSRSGTTISITSTAHGLTSGDYIVVRNMGDTDYVYGAISNVSTNSFDITNAVNSGDTSGTAGVYIPAFKVSTLSDSAITIASPSSGNCQLISMTVYIDDSQTAPKTLTLPSNSLNNGAGQNGSLATRVPPSFRAYGGGSAIGDASYTFSTTTNHNVYSLGGTIDPFGAVLLTFSF